MERNYQQKAVDEIAEMLWTKYQQKKTWAFYGSMGSGKTTLIKSLCNHVLKTRDQVSSPTFAIINEYESDLVGKIFHMDWYRLADEQEAVGAGVEDTLNSGALCLVEWPERAPLLLPEDTLHLQIDIISPTDRRIFERS